MKIYLKKQNNVLVPSLPQDSEIFDKWNNGDILECEVRKPRNIKFHRKFFALLNMVYENQEKYSNFNDFRTEIILRCGFYKSHVNVNGEIMYFPKSIAFSNMDEIEFTHLYDKAIDVVLKYFMPKASKEEIEKMVLIVLNFS